MKLGAAINFKNSIQDKKQAIVLLTCFVWILTKLFSYNLWHADRLFPLIPPFAFLEDIPNFIHLLLFWSVLGGLFFTAFYQNNKYLLTFTIVLEFCSCMLDQNRWQPYEYQFFLTLLFALCYRNNPKQFLNYFAFLLIVVYINSGLHKLSGAFLYSVWENMILHRFFGFDKILFRNPFIHYGGLLVAFIEFGAGIGLLFFKRKILYATVLILMHVFILLVLSPTGLNYNSIVWPWNFIMIIYLYVIFCNGTAIEINWSGLFSGFNKIHFIYLGLFPLLCFFGWYDNFLSFNVYSGTGKNLEICLDNPENAEEYEPFFEQKSRFCKTGYSIKINQWSLKEMNIIAYPEERILMGIIKKFKERNPTVKATYIIYEYPYKPENVIEYK